MRYLISLLIIFPVFLASFSTANAATNCSDAYYINETLPNGARWDMCWEHRTREGIVFKFIHYTPKNGTRRLVLGHAAVAQIHVPYDDNGARYHDISDYGIGGNNMLSLQSDECPAGNLLRFGGKNVLCKQVGKRDFAFKSGNNTLSGNYLSVFSISPVGAYYYIPTWRFMDDGTIEPWIGATGALQRFGTNQSRGWKMSDNRTGIAHLHNFFWKLDFDLNTTANNDVVEELNFPLVNGKRQRTTTTFTKEASRKVNPDTMRRWRIRDNNTKNSNNHNISYDIVLSDTGHQDIGPASEPFTHNDFYVTKQNDSEKFASHNPTGRRNLAEFVNGETVANNDVVIWAGVTFYHMPRSEDAPHMDAHWSHMQIIPRDWHSSNPLSDLVINTPPSINTPVNQNSKTGVAVSLLVEASDVDGDTLVYSATGLPTGLSINSATGVISGTPSSAGTFSATVSVNDGTDSSSSPFTWVVTTTVINRPPQITNISSKTSQVGDAINVAVQATDPDGDTLSYSATGLPSGLAINATTGVISGNLSTAGNYTVNITVSDSQTSASMQFSWAVTAPSGSLSNEVSNTAINVNGTLSDWSGLTYYANDPDDVSGANNRIDWLKVAIAHSPQNVYFAYQNRDVIDPTASTGTYLPWGWQAFLDTDNNPATGYKFGAIGVDYLIEGTEILHYIGTGTSWSWDAVGNTQTSYNNKNAELSFPRTIIGNPQSMRVVFLGNSAAIGGTSADLYPNSGSFSYSFTGTQPVNTPPVAANQQISVGSGASISVILEATDIDNDPLNYVVTQQPAHGTLSGSAPNLVYTANVSYTGDDSFKFVANDGTINSPVATINIIVSSGQNTGAVSNFVTSAISIDGNDTDWAGLVHFNDDPNDASGVINWRSAAFAHDDQTFYMMHVNRGNVDPNTSTGTYLAWGWQAYIDSDKQASTGYRVGTIGADFLVSGDSLYRYTGTGANWSWEFVAGLTSRYKNNIAELSIAKSHLANTDSIRVVFVGANVAYQGTDVDYYPDGQNDATASLRYFEYDFVGSGGSNTRPVAYAQSVVASSGVNKNITLLATDPDNNTLTYHIATQPQHGTLTGTAPNLIYKSDAAYAGSDSFSFNVNDGVVDSATVTVTINVTGASNGVYSNLVSSIVINGNNEEWSALTPFTSDSNDISGTNNYINWNYAAIAHNSDNLYFMYRNFGDINPDINNGSYMSWGWQAYLDTDQDNATGYKIASGLGADYLIQGGEIHRYTGTGNNWSWEFVHDATLDFNADTAEFGFPRSMIGSPAKFRVVFRGINAAHNGTAVDNYPDNLAYFEYKMTGARAVSLNRPVAKDQAVSVGSNQKQQLTLIASDEDDDVLTFRILEQPSHGRLSNQNGNKILYLPDNNYQGKDSFRFVASDGIFDSSVATITLNVGTGSGGNTGGGKSSGGGSMPYEWLLVLSLVALFRKRKAIQMQKSIKQILISFVVLLPLLFVNSYAMSAKWHMAEESSKRLFKAYLNCENEPKVGVFHNCWLILKADEKFISNAEVKIRGRMPKHQHGLPTMPKVVWSSSDGHYLIKGLKFSMPGYWVLDFSISSSIMKDQDFVSFRFTI